MRGFQISALSNALAFAVRADGKEISGERVADLMREAIAENKAEVSGNFLPVTSMFLVFADFSDKLGRELGHEIDPEGFALDWADNYPQLNKACAKMQVLVIETMSRVGEMLREACGFDPGEVFTRMLRDDISAETAAAQLEAERQQPTIH